MDQLLLQPAGGFGIKKYLRPNSRHADGRGMEAAQTSTSRRRRLPASCHAWNSEWDSGQRAPISHQFLDRDPDGAPATRAVSSLVHMLARSEGHDIARPNPDPATNRHGSVADRKTYFDHIGRHRDEGDARQLFRRRR